jgi:hypothetical protein
VHFLICVIINNIIKVPKRVRTEDENESGAEKVFVAPSMKHIYFKSWKHFDEEFERYCEDTSQLFR